MIVPKKGKVPVASQPVKAKASACSDLDWKFGYHSRLPILETIKSMNIIIDSKL